MLIFFIAACGLFGLSHADAKTDKFAIYNGKKVYYDTLFEPKCALAVRNSVGKLKKGDFLMIDIACEQYRISKDDDVIYPFINSLREPSAIAKKRDFISLDELSEWKGKPPFRVIFFIGSVIEDPDPPLNPSYLPYDEKNKIKNYIMIDDSGYEVSLSGKKRTGYRFYQFMDRCYLATERKPRKYKSVTFCPNSGRSGYVFPETVDTIGQPWINITEKNTIDLGKRMPDTVVIAGERPVKPLIYSDFPIGDNGRVTQGRAMCMADCAPGMLFRLLKKGQSIWGASGKPPPQEKH